MDLCTRASLSTLLLLALLAFSPASHSDSFVKNYECEEAVEGDGELWFSNVFDVMFYSINGGEVLFHFKDQFADRFSDSCPVRVQLIVYEGLAPGSEVDVRAGIDGIFGKTDLQSFNMWLGGVKGPFQVFLEVEESPCGVRRSWCRVYEWSAEE